MTDLVRFDLLADSGSKERARETPVEIARDHTPDAYLVAFEDSEHVHEVTLQRTTEGWHGDCWMLDERDGSRTGRCRGWAFHDGPCAHLWAVRSKIARERLSDDDERHSTDVERAVADGGHHRAEDGGRR